MFRLKENLQLGFDRKAYCLLPVIIFQFVLFSVPGLKSQTPSSVQDLRTNIQEAFIKDVVIINTAIIKSTVDLPEHLLVRGYTMPSNYFIIRMPVEGWNEKLFIGGCGAGCGTLPTEITGRMKTALERGYITATMNTGHWSPSMFDFSWALNNPQGELDYADRAVHETLRASEKIASIFYSRLPELSYFWGCSGGGRQAVMAATKYPKDFDGVIAEAPALNFTNGVIYLAWLRQTNTSPDGKDILTKEDLPLIIQAIKNKCEHTEGILKDPSDCRFDPEELLCENNEDCLSENKVEVFKQWYQGPVNSDGKHVLSSGLTIGSEPFWRMWLLGVSDEPFNELLDSESFLKYISFKDDPGPDYSVFDFDFDADPERMNYMGRILNVDNRSLESFRLEGGKLLMFHGLADPAIPYQFSVDYYNQNFTSFGKTIYDFFRLFLIPGLDHCAAFSDLGISGASLDPLTMLEDWVENEQPPLEMPVTRFMEDGSVHSKFMVPPYAVKNK